MTLPPIKQIVLATESSGCAEQAFGYARFLERACPAAVDILHVVAPPDDGVSQLLTTTAPKFRDATQVLIRVAKEHGRQVLEQVRKVVTHCSLTIHPELVEDCPAEEIIRAAARTHADLVILGSPGMTGMTGAFLDSVSRKVARHAPCSVLVVKRNGE